MFLDRLKFKRRPSVWEWAQANLRLPVKTSPNAPGRLSFAGQEYLREPLELLRDDAVQQIVLCFGAQVAKTTVDLVAFAYMQAHEPRPALWALSTKELAKQFSRERFRPFLEANAWMLEGVRAEDFGTLGVQFRSNNLAFVGVNNPGELSSRPVAFVVMDEAGKYQHVVKAEAEPDKLIEARTNSFRRKKMLVTSTPSGEEQPFWQRFLLTDQRHYYVPCPHCGEFFELRFSLKTLVWDHPADGDKVDFETVRRTARYICPHCAAELFEKDKAGMIAAGKWVSHNPVAEGGSARGYHLNALYSRWMTWGEVAERFVRAARSAEGAYALQDFTNSYLAEPFAVYNVRVREENVEKLRCVEYARGEVPVGAQYLSIAYDCHNKGQYWVVCAHALDGTQSVVDWGVVNAIEDIPAHCASLEYGGKPITVGYVDSGYQTEKVYAACGKSAGKLWPTKGTDSRHGTWTEMSIPGWPLLTLTLYSDHQAKTALYGERIASGRGDVLRVPRDADQALMAGLSGQELGRRNGARFATWKKVAEDHFGDCVKLCALTWSVVGRQLTRAVERVAVPSEVASDNSGA